ncbi:MAG: GNAT family N-acetyltransferase [Nocardioidaceae bacterium]|nr:GNAT family N-acetyltransferase [Nocardioidaceae bacterium]
MQVPDVTPRLQQGNLLLRGFEPADVDGRRRCGKDPEIIRMFGGSPSYTEPTEMTPDEAASWYQHVSADRNPLHWAIELDGAFAGTARLHHLDEVDQRARYAVGILDRDRLGTGLGQRVTRLVLGYGFRQLGLHRVDSRVLAFNERALRSYRRSGFVEEGRERESAHIGDAWYDDVMMGILATEFPAAG